MALQLGLDACQLEIAQKATDIARYCWSKSAEVMRRHAQGEDLSTAHMISVLARHGSSIRAIARSTGLSQYGAPLFLRGGEEAAVRKAPAKRAEKLDSFKAYIRERVAAAAPDRIPAVVLFRELRTRGYGGCETRVKDFVRGLRTMPAPDPVVRFETDPGRQMQADWATVGRGAGRRGSKLIAVAAGELNHAVVPQGDLRFRGENGFSAEPTQLCDMAREPAMMQERGDPGRNEERKDDAGENIETTHDALTSPSRLVPL